MSDTNKRKDERFWRDMAVEMREALRLRPLTPAEAAAEYDAADDEPLTDEEIERYVRAACDRVPREGSYEERIGRAAEQRTLADEVSEVIGLNRNGNGDGFDPEVVEEMRRQREATDREGDDDPDEQADH